MTAPTQRMKVATEKHSKNIVKRGKVQVTNVKSKYFQYIKFKIKLIFVLNLFRKMKLNHQ